MSLIESLSHIDPLPLMLTAILAELRLFQTGSIPPPASRFLCEHLHQKVFFWACISRIHAQVPIVTTGQLAKTLRQLAGRDDRDLRVDAGDACPEEDLLVQVLAEEARSGRRNRTCLEQAKFS